MEQQDLFENPKKDPIIPNFYNNEDPKGNGKKPSRIKVTGFVQHTVQPPSKYPERNLTDYGNPDEQNIVMNNQR